MVREAAGGPGGTAGGICAGRMRAATVPGCDRRCRCGSGRRSRCGDRCGRRRERPAASVRDAAMRGMGDGGMGADGVTSLPPELDWKPRALRLHLWIENGEGRGGAHVYIVRDL
jgi:hypothetical protein